MFEKPCCYCRKTLPLESFAKNRTMKDGLQARCRDCHREAIVKSKKLRAERGGPLVVDKEGPRTCITCEETKPVTEFHLRHANDDNAGRKRRCKACDAQYMASRRVLRGDEIRAIEKRSKLKHIGKTRSRENAKYAALKKKVLEHLGTVCRRCGFSDPRALQIDHVHGGGCNELLGERKGRNRTLYLRNVIADITGKYQLLCANCNWIKRHEMYEQQGRPRVTPV